MVKLFIVFASWALSQLVTLATAYFFVILTLKFVCRLTSFDVLRAFWVSNTVCNGSGFSSCLPEIIILLTASALSRVSSGIFSNVPGVFWLRLLRAPRLCSLTLAAHSSVLLPASCTLLKNVSVLHLTFCVECTSPQIPALPLHRQLPLPEWTSKQLQDALLSDTFGQSLVDALLRWGYWQVAVGEKKDNVCSMIKLLIHYWYRAKNLYLVPAVTTEVVLCFHFLTGLC